MSIQLYLLFRAAQDKVITLIFRLMDEFQCDRASKDYRLKFPGTHLGVHCKQFCNRLMSQGKRRENSVECLSFN